MLRTDQCPGQHAHCCKGVIELSKEVENFQVSCESLVAKLHWLQSQVLEPVLPSLQEDSKRPCMQAAPQETPRRSQSVQFGEDAPTRSQSVQFDDDVMPPWKQQPHGPVAPELEESNGDALCDKHDNDLDLDMELVVTQTVNFIKSEDELYESEGIACSSISLQAIVPHNDFHLDDFWHELFFINEKIAEEQLEKIYWEVRREHLAAARDVGIFEMAAVTRPWCKPIHPSSRTRVCWEVAGMLFLLWDFLSIPVQTAWDMEPRSGSVEHVLFLISLIYWVLDIVLNFCTAAYMKDGYLTSSFRQVASHYARAWLPIDLVVVSVDYCLAILGDDTLRDMRPLRLLRIVRLIRMIKLNRLSRDFENWCVTNGMKVAAPTFSLLQVTLGLLGMLHMSGCFMFLVGRLTFENGDISWISTYFLPDATWQYQYLKAFHWMFAQFSPAPFQWMPQNIHEQAFMIVVLLIGMPVISSSLAKLIGLVSQMKLQSSERLRMQQQLGRYIIENQFPAELSFEVLHFIDHKLKQTRRSVGKPDALELLPPSISVQLTLAKVGQALRIHPLIGLIMDSKLDVVNGLCQAFELKSFGPKFSIFEKGCLCLGMYITAKGSFVQLKKDSMNMTAKGSFVYLSSPKNKQDQSNSLSPPRLTRGASFNIKPRVSSSGQLVEEAFQDVSQWFAELSLFTKLSHATTLRTASVGDVWTISSADFANAISGCPISTVATHEYAKALLAKVNSDPDITLTDSLPMEMCYDACLSTQLSQAMFPRGEGNHEMQEALSSIPQSMDSDSMTNLVSGLLTGKEVDDELLQEMLPELHETLGTYAAFSHLDERRNCVLGVLSAVWLAADNYEAITSIQHDPDKRLKRETWKKLRNFVKWANVDEGMLHGALVFLTIRGLGKSKMFTHMCPPSAQSCPEYGVAYAMQERKTLVPSVELLPRHMFNMVQSALLLNVDFNFAQFIQGENIPYNVSLLEQAVENEDDRLLKFYLFSMVCMMSGLTGKASCNGSLFLTEQNATNLLNGLQYLKSVSSMEPQLIYWSYISRRAGQLAIGRKTREQLAFARMVCMTRTMDKKDLDSLQATWKQLADNDRKTLVKWFTADGLTTQSLIMMFLPSYFSNSIANPVVGLRFALVNLLDLLDRVEEHMDKAQAFAYTIDLAHLAAMVTDVKEKQGLCECIKILRIVRKDTNIYLVLTKECRQAVAKTAWKRVRDRSRGHADIDADLERQWQMNQSLVNEMDI